MQQIIFSIILLLIFWLITNYIFNKYKTLNDFSITILKSRKTIMFNMIVLVFFILFNIKILVWIAIIYYIIIGILSGILLIISFITGLDENIKNKNIDTDFWNMCIVNFLNEFSNIIMIFTLISLVK